MSFKLGTTAINGAFLGSTAINKAYLGSTEVFSVGGGGDAWAIGGASPELVASFLTIADGTTEGEYFRTAGVEDDFSMFTFSRSGLATMFDSTGTLVWAPHNYALFNEDFNNAAWTKSGLTVTADVDAAFGGSSDKLVSSAATSTMRVSDTVTGAGSVQHTLEVVAKADGFDWLLLWQDGPNRGLFFDVANGATGSAYAGATGTIAAVGDGYYRCRMVVPSWVTHSLILWISNANGSLTITGDGTSGVLVRSVALYRSDLPMADNPDAPTGLEKHVQTTASAVYLPRRNAYYYNGTAWTKGGLQLESAAATQLLHGTDSFATQTESVTAQAYTLQFRGTGSIALTGAHTATLNGTGANDLVSLTFTPSAGTLTLTPSGTVDYPQLEVGSIPTSYIPNTAGSGTVARAAETLSIAGADTPANTTAMSISMKGLVTYADTNSASEKTFLRWYNDASNYFIWYLYTNGGTGGPYITQVAAGTSDLVLGNGSSITPGVNSPFNIAARHTSGAINVAINGTAATANTTPTALADLSSTTLQVGQNFGGFISEMRIFGTDIGDSGIAGVTA